MAEQTVNSTEYKELYAQYNWFANAYPNAIQEACDEFFLPGFKFVFVGLSKNINTFMDKQAYFVTKVRIDKLHDMFFRFSEKTIEIILNRVLGKPKNKFNLNRLTDLEAKIITAFNDYLYNSISSFLSPAPPTLKRSNFDVIHLNFLLKDEETKEVSKFIITLPEELLTPDVVTSSEDKFSYGDFESSIIEASIKVGTTSFKLIDIKNIEVDDIVVFDNSETTRMILKFKEYEKDINLNPNLGLIIPVDNNIGEDNMPENTNLWDTIEVEMGAQFDSVKITLGELKNIEQGLVVDLTSIYDNKVTLSVEDKPIARGSLVIVNDRYGVKIDEVIAIGKTSEVSPAVQDNQNATVSDDVPVEENSDTNYDELQYDEQTSDAPNNSEDEDEFDYSDFELEDEDI